MGKAFAKRSAHRGRGCSLPEYVNSYADLMKCNPRLSRGLHCIRVHVRRGVISSSSLLRNKSRRFPRIRRIGNNTSDHKSRPCSRCTCHSRGTCAIQSRRIDTACLRIPWEGYKVSSILCHDRIAWYSHRIYPARTAQHSLTIVRSRAVYPKVRSLYSPHRYDRNLLW